MASCATNSQKAEDKQDVEILSKNSLHKDNFNYKPSINHSYLTEKNVGEIITVKGKLLQNEDSFRLLENPTSKSRVTFILEVEEVSLKKELQALSSQTITVNGELTDASSTWTKKMKVLKVEQK